MNLLEGLNREQQKAVETDGPTIIIAGPGTGKTKTLTARIVYLIQHKHIKPEDILALTFTKKAATEMKERLHFLEELPCVGTFHSLALQTIKNRADGISIIPDTEYQEVLQLLYKMQTNKEGSNKDIKALSLYISNYKNNIQSGPDVFIDEYNRLLQERNYIDYDDLLLKSYQYLQQDAVSKKFQYVLVDEFQDTNNLQYQMIKLILEGDNLFVIGDPYQSIYSFRGANEDILHQLEEDFPTAKRITLQMNYRSPPEVIRSSVSLFPNKIMLTPFLTEKGEVQHITTLNEFTEAEWIVDAINTKIGGTDLIQAGNLQVENKREICFKDFAVIYRTHAFSRVLEEKFINSGIPYQIVGGNSLYEKPEVAFVIAVIQYIYKPSAENLHQILISPVLGLSKRSKQRVSHMFYHEHDRFIDEFKMYKGESILEMKDIKMVSTFIHDVDEITEDIHSNMINDVIHTIVVLNVLQEYIKDKETKARNVKQLQSLITQFDSLEKIYTYLTYLQEHEFYDPSVDKVALLTMHAAKGLEFGYVFIPGFEDGIIPFIKKGELENVEEERRLLYVAMTRAKKGLYLMTSRKRNHKGVKQSRFHDKIRDILDIEDEVIAKREKQIKKWKEKKSQMTLF